MQCPLDNNNLVMTERQGIEIDYCPQCRGVWLDRGELDKIIERSGTSAVAPVAAQPLNDHRNYEQPRSADSHYRHEQRHDNQGYHHKKHKKENFLGDLFDF
jgi:Zn-finger nucleic acid-binding protein